MASVGNYLVACFSMNASVTLYSLPCPLKKLVKVP